MSSDQIDFIKLVRNHVLALALTAMSRREVEELELSNAPGKGLKLGIHKAIGRFLSDDLKRSRGLLREHKLWVKDEPERVGDVMRYQYSLRGQQDVFEISRRSIKQGLSARVDEYEEAMRKIEWHG